MEIKYAVPIHHTTQVKGVLLPESSIQIYHV